LIEQANRRAAQLVEEARTQASAEGERIRQQAKETVDQDINAAREELRQQVAALAVAGAEKILNQQVDAEAHNAMLTQLAAKL
jgi:F-type H+-transporting ATPase subunit b